MVINKTGIVSINVILIAYIGLYGNQDMQDIKFVSADSYKAK